MKKYYLFVMKNEVYKIYVKNPAILYQTLYNLYQLESYDLSYGVSLYHQLCQPFSVKLLENYIKEKYKYNIINNKVIKMKSMIEKTFVQIGYATTVIFTDTKYPELLKIFNTYNRKIFICDFDHRNYFWLSREIIKIGKNSKKTHILL